jgi:hypothetical protein
VDDFRIAAGAVGGELDFDLERHDPHAGHALHHLLHLVLLHESVQLTGERHDPILDSHTHLCRVDRGLPFKFGVHVLHGLRIGFHA